MIDTAYELAYRNAKSAFDGLLPEDFLRDYHQIVKYAVRLDSHKNEIRIPFDFFYLPEEEGLRCVKEATNNTNDRRVWRKLYTQYEIDQMTNVNQKRYCQDALNAWEEYSKEIESIPEEEFDEKTEELLSTKYEKFTMFRNYDLERVSFNFWLGHSPNSCEPSYISYCADFQLLRGWDGNDFADMESVDDIRKLCEDRGVRYSEGIATAILWYKNVKEHVS